MPKLLRSPRGCCAPPPDYPHPGAFTQPFAFIFACAALCCLYTRAFLAQVTFKVEFQAGASGRNFGWVKLDGESLAAAVAAAGWARVKDQGANSKSSELDELVSSSSPGCCWGGGGVRWLIFAVLRLSRRGCDEGKVRRGKGKTRVHTINTGSGFSLSLSLSLSRPLPRFACHSDLCTTRVTHPRMPPSLPLSPLRQVELGKTAEATKLGIFTDDSAKQAQGVGRGCRFCERVACPVCVLLPGFR